MVNPWILRELEFQVVKLSYENKLSHISSCLSSLPIIYDIYANKHRDEPFVLSNGHAGLALYVVLEYLRLSGDMTAMELYHKHGVHPNRDIKHGIDVSTGSLGSGLPIAVGMALADTARNVYCLISDGECAEGSIWESLSLIFKASLINLKVHVNMNGYSAFGDIDKDVLTKKLTAFLPNITIHTNAMKFDIFNLGKSIYAYTDVGLPGHYDVITKDQYKEYLEKYKDSANSVVFKL